MGVETKTFRKKLLAASVSSCMLASASSVFAQSDEPAVIEEVQVFGIRASVQASMDVKRDSSGVVDAITAEDIGKMPDGNLAESLQRIAGVSIDRTNGEGSKVTVRGIDPALNMVTLNGRVMPAVTNDGSAGDKASRAFDFANLASESVTGVEVYKTGKAEVGGGGLGATVNLKTIRPLDAGNKLSLAAKAVQDTTVYRGNGDEYTPEVSGLFSWVNDDENFGVSLTTSYQERSSSRSNAFVNNWQLQTAGAAEAPSDANGQQGTLDGVIPAQYDHDNDSTTDMVPVSVTNLPAAGSLYALPTDLRYALEDNHRERTNAQLTMQFAPSDSVTATLDYTFSKNDLTADRSQQSTWYNISAISSLVFDTGSSVATPLIYNEAYPASGKDVSFAQEDFSSVSHSNSFGANVSWDVTDAFNLTFDFHNSTARNKTYQAQMGLNANIVTSEYSNWSTDLPVMGVTIDDSDPSKGNNNGILDGGDVSGAMGAIAVDSQLAEVTQFRVLGDVDLGEIAFFNETKLSFGADMRQDSNRGIVNKGESPRITMGNWGGVDPDSFGGDWANYFTVRDFGQGFDQGDTTGHSEFLDRGLDGDFFAIKDALEATYAKAQTMIKVMGDDPTTPLDDDGNGEEYYWVNAIAADAAEPWLYRENNVHPDNFKDFPDGQFKPNSNVDVNRTIEEEVSAFFIGFSGGFDIGGMAANLGLGVRYEKTDLTSIAVASVPENVLWTSDNDWSLVPGPEKEGYVVENSYDNLLPNLDFDIDVTDDVKVRASYSVTMARPGYSQLKSDVSIDNIYLRQASGGNPLLESLESENIDLSAEWYYTEDSYVSIGYFGKDVSNFIGNTVTTESNIYNLRDPRLGTLAVESGIDQSQEAALHTAVCGGSPCVALATDPYTEWAYSGPKNANEESITGMEFSVQHWFGDTGFGMQANYTMVDSDLEFDETLTTEQFALIGLSDTYNLVGFYDNDGLQVRVAYNWRDKFLSDTAQGGNNAPGYTDEFAQLDFSISYDVSDSVTLSLEGLNVLGEDYRVHGRSSAQMFTFEDLGARYAAGVRVTF